jgi:hypothetical protein
MTDKPGTPDGAPVTDALALLPRYLRDMEPLERAWTEAEHERCEDGDPHPVTAHEPFDIEEGDEPWSMFMDRLQRHGLTLALAADPQPAPRQEEVDVVAEQVAMLQEGVPNIHRRFSDEEYAAFKRSEYERIKPAFLTDPQPALLDDRERLAAALNATYGRNFGGARFADWLSDADYIIARLATEGQK